MKKQTAVDYITEMIKLNDKEFYAMLFEDKVIEQAKEMEKQQIKDAFDEGQEYEYQYHINNAPKFDSQTYFTETYGSKGSDETLKGNHIVDTNEMISSQTEISDDEIENAWDSYKRECLEKFMKDTMIAGYAITNKETFAKWYREQLKQRQ